MATEEGSGCGSKRATMRNPCANEIILHLDCINVNILAVDIVLQFDKMLPLVGKGYMGSPCIIFITEHEYIIISK